MDSHAKYGRDWQSDLIFLMPEFLLILAIYFAYCYRVISSDFRPLEHVKGLVH